ncbi:MAG: VOC family protein [Candidatus Acidiferrum sp.]
MLSRRCFLSASTLSLAASLLPLERSFAVDADSVVPPDLDHIIIGFPNLEDGMARLFHLSGYHPAVGGSHPNLGTRNAILNLGHNSYLELLSPDPAQPALLWHKEIASLTELTIVGWARRHADLDQLASVLKERGVASLDPLPGSRVRPDGETLRWRTLRLVDDQKGNLPFFIDWDSSSPHPSNDAPGGCLLQDFRPTGALPEIPPPQAGMSLHLVPGKQSQLQAKIAGLNGVIFQLSSIPVPSQYWVPKEPPML